MANSLHQTTREPTGDIHRIKVWWHLSEATNRWVATGPMGFRWTNSLCDEPLTEARERMMREIERNNDV